MSDHSELTKRLVAEGLKPPRFGSKNELMLAALLRGPKTSAQLGEIADEITPYVARTMAKLRERGLVVNRNEGGALALYDLTEAGRAAMERGRAA